MAAFFLFTTTVAADHPVEVLWGDTHLHTELSADGYMSGTRLGPEEAYRFAQGETVTSTTGLPVQLDRPLDFLVVADHANNLGASWARANHRDDAGFRRSTLGKLWEKAKAELLLDTDPLHTMHRDGLVSVRHEGFRQTVWGTITAAAERHNDPGDFTALIGYEWTPAIGALHRVVVFRDGAERANQVLPFSSFDSSYVEDLWDFLATYERETGGSVLAIPHNSNLTWGMMFALETSLGDPLDVDYARTRARWEPLLEVTQIKGDSETHPRLSPRDRFADFETWNGWGGVGPNPDRPADKIRFEYARSALKLGLDQFEELGANPFKFGMVGGTDAHTGLATAAENNSFGKFAFSEPSPTRMFDEWPGWMASSGGYAGVWATENTREAIFDAMRRREVYASTGPRITLRFFGGWDFDAGDADRPDFATVGYGKGVPMGGDLAAPDAEAAPSFLVVAAKDPLGANLDRIQIVKGWRSESGGLHERVFDVAWSGAREPGPEGELPPVGSTVDVADASYTNAIGSVELATVWRDPEFRTGEHAFYYVRVLEIPTPRWTAYDAKVYGLGKLPSGVPTVIQERAYSSPIWYTAEP